MLRPKWADQLVTSILDTYGNADYKAWLPFDGDCLIPYYYTLQGKRLYRIVNQLQSAGISAKIMAGKLKKIRPICEEIDNLMAYWPCGDLKLSNQEFGVVTRYLIGICRSACVGDPFSYYGYFRLYSKDKINQLINQTSLIQADIVKAREVSKLIIAANNLAYALYTDIFPSVVGNMCHGPYLVNGSQLVIRDYLDLAPNQHWSHALNWQIKSLRILTIYKKGTDLKIDFYGNLYSKDNLVEKLEFFVVLANGKPVNLDQIQGLYFEVAKRAIDQNNKFQALNLERVKKKFMEAHCYYVKEIMDLVGVNWRPTPEMYQSIAGKKLLEVEIKWVDRNYYNKMLEKSIKAILN